MLAGLCGRVPPPRRVSLRRLRERGRLDHAMVLWLPGPGSYTGEDSAELYLHGGRAVLTAWPMRWWRSAPGRRSRANSPAARSSTAGWT